MRNKKIVTGTKFRMLSLVLSLVRSDIVLSVVLLAFCLPTPAAALSRRGLIVVSGLWENTWSSIPGIYFEVMYSVTYAPWIITGAVAYGCRAYIDRTDPLRVGVDMLRHMVRSRQPRLTLKKN